MLLTLLFLVAAALPPKPAHYVTDVNGVLDAAREEALNQKLAQFERDTSNQLLVYIDKDLPPDTTIEEMGSEAIHQWGVGQKGKDNGAILFVFTGAKKMRIEVGYGLEATLTDAKSKRILSTVMKPKLKADDAAGAIEAGADAMIAAVKGAEFTGSGATHAEVSPGRAPHFSIPCGLVIFLGVVVFIGVVMIIQRSRRFRTAGSPGSATNTWSELQSLSGSSSSSNDSWSSSSSDSSSSSSDFSSGGGDGGGGGSSDSW